MLIGGESSESYYKQLGFTEPGIVFMVAMDINAVLEKTQHNKVQ
jgi:hypothetical protein